MRAKRVHVAVAVLKGGPAMVPIGLAELLRKSAELGKTVPTRRPQPELHVQLVGAGRSVSAAGDYALQCDGSFARMPRCDLAIIPAIDGRECAGLDDNKEAAGWVRRVSAAGADVASVCTGAFVLAEAGLLDGRRATTHWAFQEVLVGRFPRVRLEPQAVIVDQGRVCTAGGATTFINLALYLVERLLGPDVAKAASKMFLIDPNKAPQGAYAVFSTQKSHGDDDILAAQAHIEAELARADSVSEIARKVAMSQRTFMRRFKQATGNTPSEYVQRVRVEAAKQMLTGSRHPLAAIALQVGYRDTVAFRKVFSRFAGLTPADYRKRYGPFAEPSVLKRSKRRSARSIGEPHSYD
jgi:transcriptional regulator GlxA family with amidase domain